MCLPSVAECTERLCDCGFVDCLCNSSPVTIQSSSVRKVKAKERLRKISALGLARVLLKSIRSGTDLRNLTLPLALLDPRSALQRSLSVVQRARCLERVAEAHGSFKNDTVDRLLSVACFALSGLPREEFCKRPFSPVEGEIFRATCSHRDSKTIFITEQVSLQPSVSASLIRNDALGIDIQSFAVPKTKISGAPPNSIVVDLDGYAKMTVKTKDGRSFTYLINRPSFGTYGLLTMGPQFDAFSGSLIIRALEYGKKSLPMLTIQFTSPRLLRNTESRIRSITGSVMIDKKVKLKLKGRWDGIVTGNDGRVVWDDGKSWKEDTIPIFLPSCKDLEQANERNSLIIWRRASKAIKEENEDLLKEEFGKISQTYSMKSKNSSSLSTFFDLVEDPEGFYPFYYKFRDGDPFAAGVVAKMRQ